MSYAHQKQGRSGSALSSFSSLGHSVFPYFNADIAGLRPTGARRFKTLHFSQQEERAFIPLDGLLVLTQVEQA